MNIFSYLRSCKWYFYSLIILFLSATLFLLIGGKAASFIFLNSYHTYWLDLFFINYTYVGDGIFALCIIALVFFYFKNKPLAIALLLSFLLSGLVAQIIKNLVTSPRPRLFFKPGQYSHFIDGVSLANNSSFPSGHTATAFALSAVLAIMIKNKNWHLFFLFVAATVGYSRIYLAQHFLLDVLIAAVIGTLSGIAAVVITKNRMDARLAIHKEQTMNNDKPLISPSTAQAV